MEDDGRQLRVTAVHPIGRRKFDPVSKARLIESCLQPGASVAQPALDHGVNANLLWKWIGQHRLAKQGMAMITPPSAPTFIPVQIESAADQAMSRQSSAFALDLAAPWW
ncbi:Transposase [Paracoccus halophilus]|uniref:Transposase n=1 Tax=Paracoccus halophilus TaxID=376733 RepID=A0A1I0T0V1_9RHOB|nr:transposase [Paracoccus halophilus]SFA45330.1 Transposase [Paracoccus halophilus]